MFVKNLERRFDMCLFILEARVTHYDSLMEEFNISKSTAIRDEGMEGMRECGDGSDGFFSHFSHRKGRIK